MSINLVHRHFNVDEYYRMLEVGILSEKDHIELLEGEIIEMSPIGSRHAARIDKLIEIFFSKKARNKAIIRVQNPIRLNDNSEPEPDIVLARYRDDFYSENHPTATDVLLIIEVSDSSIQYDREVKTPLYARAGIPEVWLINTQTNSLEIYKNVTDGEYREYKKFDSNCDNTITPYLLPNMTLTINDLLK